MSVFCCFVVVNFQWIVNCYFVTFSLVITFFYIFKMFIQYTPKATVRWSLAMDYWI